MSETPQISDPATWRRTKIVCTLGPATDRPGVLEQLIGAGMDVARINASHDEHPAHARRIQQIRQLAGQMRQPVAVLLDLPGPKFRVGNLPDGQRELQRGDKVTLALNLEDPDVIPLTRPELLHALRPGETIFLVDGTIELKVETVAAESVICQVIIGGTIRSRSGINLPESELPALIPTDEDRRHIEFAVAQRVEWMGVSFVQTADDLDRVRALLPRESPPLLMAKIEKRQALANLEAIINAADGVMVARGDLGVETDLAEIPLVQKRIIALANALARPVVTAHADARINGLAKAPDAGGSNRCGQRDPRWHRRGNAFRRERHRALSSGCRANSASGAGGHRSGVWRPHGPRTSASQPGRPTG